MADHGEATPVAGSAAGEATEGGGPGTLVIKERAISRVAVAAALTVPDVVRQLGGLSRLTGRDLPRADVSVGEHSVSVNLYIAVRWPTKVADVAHGVHTEVGRVLDGFVGLPLHRLNIIVAGTTPKDSVEHTSGGDSVRALRPRPPTASPAAAFIAVVLALALLGVAFVAGREFLIAHETIGGPPWIGNAIAWIADLHWASWMITAASAAIVVGLILVVSGLSPRTKTHTGARSPESKSPIVWLRPTDVARICSDHAGSVPGSESARTTVTKRAVTVEVHRTPGGDDAAVTESVRDAVAPTLAALADTRKVRVRVRESKK